MKLAHQRHESEGEELRKTIVDLNERLAKGKEDAESASKSADAAVEALRAKLATLQRELLYNSTSFNGRRVPTLCCAEALLIMATRHCLNWGFLLGRATRQAARQPYPFEGGL